MPIKDFFFLERFNLSLATRKIVFGMSFLARQDEEFQMLLAVAEEYLGQKSGDTSQNKSGNATETVIRIVERTWVSFT